MNDLGLVVVRGLLVMVAGVLFVVSIVAFVMSYVAHENYKTGDSLREAYQQSQYDCIALVTNKSSERTRRLMDPRVGYVYSNMYFIELEIQEHCSSIMQGTSTVGVSKIAYDAVSVHDEVEIYEANGKIRLVRELEQLAEPPNHTTTMLGAIAMAACIVIVCVRLSVRRPVLSKIDQMDM